MDPVTQERNALLLMSDHFLLVVQGVPSLSDEAEKLRQRVTELENASRAKSSM